MAKTNVVLEGRYKSNGISLDKNNIIVGGFQHVTKDRVASYEVIDETNKGKYSIWKGALGVALLGGFGAVVGIGGKKTEYLIVIEWKDYPGDPEGAKSLITIDEKYYRIFIRSMF